MVVILYYRNSVLGIFYTIQLDHPVAFWLYSCPPLSFLGREFPEIQMTHLLTEIDEWNSH